MANDEYDEIGILKGVSDSRMEIKISITTKIDNKKNILSSLLIFDEKLMIDIIKIDPQEINVTHETKNIKTTDLRQCCQLLQCSIRSKGSPWTNKSRHVCAHVQRFLLL